jgi:hypothetical protein
MTALLAKGDRFYAPTMECTLTVTRAAKDQTWADLFVVATNSGISWTKRQPLRNGWFTFPVEQLHSENPR